MFEFDKIYDTLKDGTIELANNIAGEYKNEAVGDANEFFGDIKEDLKRWAEALAEGKLSKEDVSFLVQGKKELAKMLMLKQKGLAQVKIDKFKKGLTNLVSNTLIDAI